MGGTIDARSLREAMARYLEALRNHRQEIDSLNTVSVVGDDAVRVSLEALRPLVTNDHEVLTVLAGDGLDDLDGLRGTLAEAFPSLDVEVHRGGQPGAPLLIGLE